MLKKLQKVDADTNELINQYRQFLFDNGIRTSKERAWELFQHAHKLPYLMLIEANPKITYQGVGAHISHKHGKQLLVIKNVGKFEIKGVSNKKSNSKSAAIKFQPSNDIKKLLESVEVTDGKVEE